MSANVLHPIRGRRGALVAALAAVMVLAVAAPASADDGAQEDEHRVVALARWAVLSAASGSPGGALTAKRVCTDVRAGAADLSRSRTAAAGASAATSMDVLYPQSAEQRAAFTVDAALEFCGSLEGGSLSDATAGAIVDGPGGQRVSFAVAAERAALHLVPAPPGPDAAPPPVQPAPRRVGLDIAAGLVSPVTSVTDVYGAAPALRIGASISGGRWDVSMHLSSFAAPMRADVYGTSRRTVFGFAGLDVEPAYRLVSAKVLFSIGARLAGGVLGRNLEEEGRMPSRLQATGFGAMGPLFRLDVPLGELSPNLVLAPAVALIDTDGKPRLHGHVAVWIGVNQGLGRF